jgi:hypothetical protein
MNDKPKWTDIAIVILTVGIVIFAGMQWLEMEGAGKQTDKLLDYAKTQASAASDIGDAAQQFSDTAEDTNGAVSDAVEQLRIAANNAKESIRATQNAMRLDQRAWIGYQGPSNVSFTEKESLKASLRFANTGKSPARNVRYASKFKTSPTPLTDLLKTDIQGLRSEFKTAQSIPPQNALLVNANDLVAAEPNSKAAIEAYPHLLAQYQYIKNRQLFLYYFGLVKYDDIFGKHHETQFCIYLANPDTNEIGACDFFNDLN